MLNLYVKTGCPYCAAVLHKVDELGIKVNLKNIKDPEVASDLVEKGGKRQVPYMEDEEHKLSVPCTPCVIDEDNDVSLYESADIIDYLDREYNKKTSVDKVLYENQKIREIVVDKKSKYYLIRETISSKDITFKFSYDVVKRIKRGAAALKEIKSSTELDYPFEIQKKFKQPKRIFYLEQKINIEPYEN